MIYPSWFISHGAPDVLLHSLPVLECWHSLSADCPIPQAILGVSAHWTTSEPVVSAATDPETLYDFRGFPPSLSEIVYPVSGAPELAHQIVECLQEAGLTCAITPHRGLDHGAWVPLSCIYPEAQIPVTQLSIQPHRDPAYHLALGRSLSSLRSQGILIIASGSMTHNLSYFGQYPLHAEPPFWVQEFDRWMEKTLQDGDLERLTHYRQLAPYAVENHPTDEHLLPLFVALGAAGESWKSKRLHSSFTYGVLSMAAFEFC
ncbi:class III extradiol ring-cleavage dioxygenase [Roseofilum sp. BLCC_M154]|uniref:Class III extradiol ring-cleavage dioxygenase n=1 Tax=Roseofilum acuticapitatum BLCC-M154 TaxID=3022444 RepID=A0ABT7ANW6_9CYAN|nr:class III extradiol ring-cleavage dioxygenase [Roseofilum acuticapitatum]MDJ1168596.1 class III extradiol ring-cleavage dioxygenase [Roseofilum acuticapitatum BLCC-M154]